MAKLELLRIYITVLNPYIPGFLNLENQPIEFRDH